MFVGNAKASRIAEPYDSLRLRAGHVRAAEDEIKTRGLAGSLKKFSKHNQTRSDGGGSLCAAKMPLF
jgi:Cdc6-like AAA superfamily ATPase